MNKKNILEIQQAGITNFDEIFKYAVKIVRQHQSFNPRRFSNLENHDQLLEHFFRVELTNPQSVILALKRKNIIVGYALIKMEEDSLVDLISARAWLHDIFIDESARGLGGGKLLLNEAKNAARRLGSETLMLHVAEQNIFAQDLFKKNEFETVMLEMMCQV